MLNVTFRETRIFVITFGVFYDMWWLIFYVSTTIFKIESVESDKRICMSGSVNLFFLLSFYTKVEQIFHKTAICFFFLVGYA